MNKTDLLSSIMNAAMGGVLIGVASSIMLIFNGRVTGIAGIVNGVLSFPKKDTAWRLAFIGGLLLTGIIGYQLQPELFINESERTWPTVAVAGILVGYGTVMGSGCTSGHGVCGISRLSIRSIVATLSFMAAGFMTASFFRIIFLN